MTTRQKALEALRYVNEADMRLDKVQCRTFFTIYLPENEYDIIRNILQDSQSEEVKGRINIKELKECIRTGINFAECYGIRHDTNETTVNIHKRELEKLERVLAELEKL